MSEETEVFLHLDDIFDHTDILLPAVYMSYIRWGSYRSEIVHCHVRLCCLSSTEATTGREESAYFMGMCQLFT